MKRALIAVLLLTVTSFAANWKGLAPAGVGVSLNGATATGAGDGFLLGLDTNARQANAFTFVVTTTGSPTAFSVDFEGSQIGDFSDAVVLGTVDQTTSGGTTYVTNVFPANVRANLKSLSGGSSPTVTAKIYPVAMTQAIPGVSADGSGGISVAGNVAVGSPSPATDPPAGSINVAGKIYQNGVEFKGGGGSNCAKYTVAYSSLDAAATTQTINLVDLPANSVVTGLRVKEGTQFASASVTALNVSIGDSAGSVTEYAPQWSLMQAVTGTNKTDIGGFYGATALAHTVAAKFTSTGGNVNAMTAGSVDVWLCTEVLP